MMLPEEQLSRLRNARASYGSFVGKRSFSGVYRNTNPTLDYLIYQREQRAIEERKYGNFIH